MMLKTLKSTGLSQKDIDWVVPHQASGKAVDAYVNSGKFAKEKVVNIVGKYGNCVAASLPMALTIAVQEKRIKRGDIVLLIGTGAGLSAACALIRY